MTPVNPEHWPPQIMGAVDDKVSVVKDPWICVWGDIKHAISLMSSKFLCLNSHLSIFILSCLGRMSRCIVRVYN